MKDAQKHRQKTYAADTRSVKGKLMTVNIYFVTGVWIFLKKFRGTAVYVTNRWRNHIERIPDDEHMEDLELVHLRVGSLPMLQIVGAKLESSPNKIGGKNPNNQDWGEQCLLIGDLNWAPNKPQELPKTRLMTEWIDLGEVVLLNDPKTFTRFDPATGKGSTLYLIIVTPKKPTRGKYTDRDHRCIECILELNVLAAKQHVRN